MHKAKHAKSSRGILVLIGLVLCLAVGIQGTLAYLHTQTNPVVNTFTPSTVSCSVTEDFDTDTNVKSDINVSNTSDIDAYVRVALVSYRVNANGARIGGEAPIPDFTPGANWVKNGNYYYYKNPVAAGGSPAVPLVSSITLKDYGDGEHQVIEVHAEAIQSTPASAVTEAWGVNL